MRGVGRGGEKEGEGEGGGVGIWMAILSLQVCTNKKVVQSVEQYIQSKIRKTLQISRLVQSVGSKISKLVMTSDNSRMVC